MPSIAYNEYLVSDVERFEAWADDLTSVARSMPGNTGVSFAQSAGRPALFAGWSLWETREPIREYLRSRSRPLADKHQLREYVQFPRGLEVFESVIAHAGPAAGQGRYILLNEFTVRYDAAA